jgi:hypothetical protein
MFLINLFDYHVLSVLAPVQSNSYALSLSKILTINLS